LSSESFDRTTPTPVLLVGVDFGFPHFDGELEELGLLAGTAGLRPVARLTCKRKVPDAALFVGSGKADEIRMLAQMHGAQEVLFDQALSPAQQRNLERHLQMPVNDRTLLILEIFAQRARSHEGKLQVDLERQMGGIGGRGGPGEKQIELDRRMIDESIKRTKERLQKVKKQRATQRRRRERHGIFNISLVGYTNAGKSTLFNALVKARAYAADQLFATLDTTTRQLYLNEARQSVSLSDTVGFIRDLPHGLVDAFQATLQEAIDADLLLHVVDASNPNFPEQIQQVQKVLAEIGAQEVPLVLVFNKLDAVDPERRPAQLQDRYELDGLPVDRVFVSARSGEGLPQLRQLLADHALRAAAEHAQEHPGDERGDEEVDGAMPPGQDAEY
jgi:GTP-binding protein HflX